VRVWAGVGLLIISAQLCIAADARREAAADAWWSLWGEKVKAELKSLPNAGRRAFRDALIACSLYADDYDSADYKAQCERATKAFMIEFSQGGSAIELSFKTSMLSTAMTSAQLELDRQRGTRGTSSGEVRYVGLDVLQRAYRETQSR
jgi:hypothetical protein